MDRHDKNSIRLKTEPACIEVYECICLHGISEWHIHPYGLKSYLTDRTVMNIFKRTGLKKFKIIEIEVLFDRYREWSSIRVLGIPQDEPMVILTGYEFEKNFRIIRTVRKWRNPMFT